MNVSIAPNVENMRLLQTGLAAKSCKNIRLSSDVANPLSRTQSWRADGDGCMGLHVEPGVAAAPGDVPSHFWLIIRLS
jgi:hypothetical protein